MIKIINTFHHTETYVKSTTLSGRTVKRVRHALCGIDGCCCGGQLGERGGDMYGPNAISDAKYVYDWSPAPGYYDDGAIELRIVDLLP